MAGPPDGPPGQAPGGSDHESGRRHAGRSIDVRRQGVAIRTDGSASADQVAEARRRAGRRSLPAASNGQQDVEIVYNASPAAVGRTPSTGPPAIVGSARICSILHAVM